MGVGRLTGIGLLLLVLSAGCTHRLAPIATPEEVAIQMESEMAPLAEGMGRLVVDVVDGPTSVGTVQGQHLCDAPCATDVEPGRWALTFPIRGDSSRLEIGEVDVVAGETTVYRRSLGRYEPAGAGLVLGIVGTTLGGMSAITGTVLLPVGLGEDDDGMATAGWITLGVGLVVVAAGILGIVFDPHLEQPGSDIQFSIGPPAASAAPEPPAQ